MDEPMSSQATLETEIYKQIKSLKSSEDNATATATALTKQCRERFENVVNVMKRLSRENLHAEIIHFWNEVLTKLTTEQALYYKFKDALVEIVCDAVYLASKYKNENKILEILKDYKFSLEDMKKMGVSLTKKRNCFVPVTHLYTAVLENPSSFYGNKFPDSTMLRDYVYNAIICDKYDCLNPILAAGKNEAITKAILMIINKNVSDDRLTDSVRIKMLQNFLNNEAIHKAIFQNNQGAIKILLNCFDTDNKYPFSEQDKIEIRKNLSNEDTLLSLVCKSNNEISQKINSDSSPSNAHIMSSQGYFSGDTDPICYVPKKEEIVPNNGEVCLIM